MHKETRSQEIISEAITAFPSRALSGLKECLGKEDWRTEAAITQGRIKRTPPIHAEAQDKLVLFQPY